MLYFYSMSRYSTLSLEKFKGPSKKKNSKNRHRIELCDIRLHATRVPLLAVFFSFYSVCQRSFFFYRNAFSFVLLSAQLNLCAFLQREMVMKNNFDKRADTGRI